MNETAESFEGARGDDALRSAAHANAHVDASAVHGGVDAAGHVAVEQKASASAGIPNLVDERLVPRAVKHRNHHVRHRFVLGFGQSGDVDPDRLAKVDHAVALVAGDNLVHVEHRARVVHRAAVGNRDHAERVLATGSRERGTVDWVDRDVAVRPVAGANMLAVVEHRRVVFLALADDDEPVEVDGAQERAHGIDRCAIGGQLVAAADVGHRANGGSLGRAHEFHAEVAVWVEVNGGCCCAGHERIL